MEGDITQEKLEEILGNYGEVQYDEDGNITGVKVDEIDEVISIEDLYTGELGEEIEDIIPPTATIQLSTTSTTTGAEITATVSFLDNESGANVTTCKYIYNTTSWNLGTTHESWNSAQTFSSNPQTVTLTSSTAGIYYLHVLIVDNAGNIGEAVSEAITVRQLVTGITLNRTTATITEGETLQLTATVSPSNASNKTVTWSSDNSGIATVSNGLVRAIKEGTTTIRVRTNDGSNKEATCSVTVNKKIATNVNELEEGDYIYYEDGRGIQRLCAVLYDSSSSYGVEITTMNIVENIKLGDEDPTASGSDELTKLVNSYNNAIITLNNAANKYRNTNLSDSARSIGSDPKDPSSESTRKLTSTYDYMANYSGLFKANDSNYIKDESQMENLNIQNIGSIYWIASRFNNWYSSYSAVSIRYFDINRNSIYIKDLFYMTPNHSNGPSTYTYSYGLRPVFRLKLGIEITGGTGTESDPYTLGT